MSSRCTVVLCGISAPELMNDELEVRLDSEGRFYT